MRSITLMMVTLTIFLFLCNVCIANDNKNTNVNDKEWSKAFKFGENDGGFMESIQQTSDGGYILAGHIDPKNLDNDGDTLYPWLIKTDASGNKQWEKKYNIVGNKQGDIIDLTGSFSSVLQTSDGGYILAGGDGSRTTSNGFILKIDETGKEQ